ncbi:TetR family transcriptional regulator [Actinoplanes sp. NBRC 103695]|uniref:TetR/AcrR family transcriptional regulator n=1 Tax=Actinoplanes sp. NBRC 103695 TaxID=3032202 RepID=UPI0024A2AD7D|nr:TetR family transcriptional regulator [Actinoplanes sp. NBRC 103695]GLY97179.1 TetR family transcriptional regulator [Actinoplanes sp. NBRC 103695]
MTAGLRERKKAATRLALHESAVRLAIEHGAERVTVEAIADDAGVSRRTFSNYFANKEQALLHGDFERMRHLTEALRECPPTVPAWAALTTAADQLYGNLGTLDPGQVQRWRLVREHPALTAQHVNTFAVLEQELSAAIAERVPDPLRARLMAATFLAALRVSLDVWLDAPDSDLATVVRRALASSAAGFAQDL